MQIFIHLIRRHSALNSVGCNRIANSNENRMKRYFLLILCIGIFGVQAAFCQESIRGPIGTEVELPEELRKSTIHDTFMASDAEEIGTIQTVVGDVVVFHGDNNTAYIAADGDPLFKRDIIFTLADSRCRIQFTTEDLITMGDNSRIGIEAFIDDAELGNKSSIISILRGKAMFYVFRLLKYQDISSLVNTPTAVIGVRGTKFGTEVRLTEGLRADREPIYLADASGNNYLAQQQTSSPRIETLIHCFEGTLEVFSPADGITQLVDRGQSLEVTSLGAGDLQITPPEVAQQFLLETEVAAPQSEEPEEESDQEANDSNKSKKDSQGKKDSSQAKDQEQTVTDAITASNDAVQNQNTLTAEQDVIDQGEAIGYLSAMLTRIKDGIKSFQHLYISDTRQDFEVGNKVKARDKFPAENSGTLLFLIAEDSDDTEAQAEDQRNPNLTSVDVENGNGVETITGSFPIIEQMLNNDEFMEWGYWTQTDIMTSPSGGEYLVDHRGYYINGRVTTDTEMSDLISNQMKADYTGSAHGTYWTEDGGTNMTGSFKAHVDFAQKSVSEFGVSVSGDDHSVTISGASGAFTGNSSQFTIDPNTPGSVWQIDGQDALDTKKEAYGSVYGPQGEKVGGVWKLDAPSGDGEAHATGIFEGSR